MDAQPGRSRTDTVDMSHKNPSVFRSGHCASGGHAACHAVLVNGARAASRYALCRCECHDGSEEVLACVLEITSGWDVPKPLNASADEMLRYLDVVNALARPSADAENLD